MVRISDAIKDDHREIESAYRHILNAVGTDEKTRWRNQFTWELARHSVGEELILYPVIEKNIPNGKEIAAKDREDHLAVKRDLNKFQNLNPESTDFLSTLNLLWKDLSAHIAEEEEHDLPLLESTLSADDSAAMVTDFKRTKMFIPTRSHPHAPDKPPFETAVGLLTAPIDHVRDMFRKFPKEAKSQLPL